MAYYDALIAKWGTLSGTTAAKLAAINALTVAGPSQDVAPSAIVAYLALNLRLATLLKYAANPPATEAGAAAAELAAILQMGSNAPIFASSQAAVLVAVTGMLNAIAADESSGLMSTDAVNLIALASTALPWWQANGYTSPFTQADLDAIGGLS